MPDPQPKPWMFDLDGTLFDTPDHGDWTDPILVTSGGVIHEVAQLARHVHRKGHPIIYCTGRSGTVPQMRELTELQIERHNLPDGILELVKFWNGHVALAAFKRGVAQRYGVATVVGDHAVDKIAALDTGALFIDVGSRGTLWDGYGRTGPRRPVEGSHEGGSLNGMRMTTPTSASAARIGGSR